MMVMVHFRCAIPILARRVGKAWTTPQMRPSQIRRSEGGESDFEEMSDKRESEGL